MNTITVKNHRGGAVLDGKHEGYPGPLDVPAGLGKFGIINVNVEPQQDLSNLSLHRELSGSQPADLASDLHVELVDIHGRVRALCTDPRRFGSNEPIILYDTATNDKSGTVTTVEPGAYTFKIYSKSGRAYHGLVFNVLQSLPPSNNGV